MPGSPENKIFYFEPSQDEEASPMMMIAGKEESNSELEIEPTEVIDFIEKCCKFDNEIILISEAYHLAYGGPKNLLDQYSKLIDIETVMKNSVLHIAAENGNDDIVGLLIQRAPKLLFTFNQNHDTVLHVAARNGCISTFKKLLEGYTNFERHDIKIAWFDYKLYKHSEEYNGKLNMEHLLKFVQLENDQGNTMFHEAMLCDKRNIGGNIFKVCEQYKTEDWSDNSLSNSCYKYAIDIVNHAKKTVLYLAVENGNKDAVELILEKRPKNDKMPVGLSPFIAAIMIPNQEILKIILKHQFNWIHSKDTHGRLPLHYAAFIGYLEGVDLLITSCNCCTIQRDKYGYFPIHLASHGGHVRVVQKLLEYCPDPTEMLDTLGRNILHMASNNGKHLVVRYILESDQTCKHDKKHKMINQKDKEGNTPLHLAAKSFHPKSVLYLTWDKRVGYDLVNKNNQTALDVHNETSRLRRPSTKQQLTFIALNSAGVQTSCTRADHDKLRQNDSISPKLTKSSESGEIVTTTQIESLILVSTLIITASVAACFSVPGEADGRANNLYHAMFQCFIIFITISLFSSISTTIILFWATLGLSELASLSLKIVMPLLGIALISLTLAFMAGLYTVISPLNWLANLFLVVAVIFFVLVILLYIIIFFGPSISGRNSMPFLFIAWLVKHFS